MQQQLSLLDDVRPVALEAAIGGLSIRESRRAKRLILQLLPPHRIELVVPVGTRAKDVRIFVDENRHWIERARAEIDTRYVADRSGIPERIELPAIDRSVAVDYRDSPRSRAGYRSAGDRLQVFSADSERRDVAPILQQWLISLGRDALNPWLLREAEAVGDTPKKIQVRLQQTRWGSCSAHGTISLNASLLFLEPPLVRYLIIHELSHLRAMNHSRAFWTRVRRHEPDYRRLDRELANAWTRVPYWIFVK